MLESLVGLIIPSTRQKSGRFGIGSALGGVNDPAATDWATVIVVPGRFKPARLSQATTGVAVAGLPAFRPCSFRDHALFSNCGCTAERPSNTRSRRPNGLIANEAAAARKRTTISNAPASI